MGKWIEKKNNWLKNGNGNLNRQPDEDNTADDTYGVAYIPLRCPRCHSKKVRCYAHRLPARYHYCLKCGYRFKSIEQDYEK
jgi:predicted RNA-binding Zn-ribbon protein involved in translation (DUF1610 family)